MRDGGEREMLRDGYERERERELWRRCERERERESSAESRGRKGGKRGANIWLRAGRCILCNKRSGVCNKIDKIITSTGRFFLNIFKNGD